LPHPEVPARSAGLEGCPPQRLGCSSFEARLRVAYARERANALAPQDEGQ
jgi:hypothetical protein